MGVTFCAVARRASAGGASRRSAIAALRGVHRRMQARQRHGGRPRDDGEEGRCRTGLYVAHPLTGAEVEVWVGNYVLMSYGEGAVMGVPAHDERDFAFAKKYGLPILPGDRASTGEAFDDRALAAVVRRQDARRRASIPASTTASRYEAAVDAIAADLARRGARREAHDVSPARLGHLAPALLGHADPDHPLRRRAATVPVPEQDLPVVLPEDLRARRQRQPARTSAPTSSNVACPRATAPARRETDTMDTFVDSSWYFMRYACPGAATMVDARDDYWMPMDQYIGGIEHAILHLLYARFWTKVMRDMGMVGYDEPFTRLLTQGMVLDHAFFRRNDKGGVDYIAPADVDITRNDQRPRSSAAPRSSTAAGRIRRPRHDVEVEAQRRRSAGNDRALRRRHRAPVRDVRRARPSRRSSGRTNGVEGTHRFLRRLWTFAQAQRTPTSRRPRFELARRSGNAAAHGAARDARCAQAGELRLRAHPVQHRGVGRR